MTDSCGTVHYMNFHEVYPDVTNREFHLSICVLLRVKDKQKKPKWCMTISTIFSKVKKKTVTARKSCYFLLYVIKLMRTAKIQ